jgi:hypothetical protein
MDGNIITSAVGSQNLINFQQLMMVVGGKRLVFFFAFVFFCFLQIMWDNIIIWRFLVLRVLGVWSCLVILYF